MENLLYDFYALFVENSLLNDLYDETLLTSLTLTMLVFVLVGVAIYYFGMNKVRYAKASTWLAVLGSSAVLTMIVAIVTCSQKAAQEIPRRKGHPEQGRFFDQGGSIFFGFGFEMLILAAILFFVLSLVVKNVSTNNRKIPF
ncbi:hypothetical protein BWI93_06360 [Siphonobacter sp. BAB-5385]|uniref:Uncharacterized protein n=1 Tax=Siphonobacter curvatus TaxID=2094562 RepID=A0A2S7IS65_9BACT|nr:MULTISPECIES: hypothetical protein [Siphonobacter]OZI08854.1 hypothetical protein BWI93_06360 [Siphonobacter sp. BAB-5385]PMD96702.1 hypothetical protein BWI97_11060 [Siphonobacter sp. BAB-5405]PQA60557.1 hypothetical protein C5O19_13350 [Siphonobacter curvatus]